MHSQTHDKAALNIAANLRTSADRYQRNGKIATAILFSNDAWRIETGLEWLEIQAQSKQQDARDVEPIEVRQ